MMQSGMEIQQGIIADLERKIAELERQLAVAVEALSDIPNQVPTTWLDPLLTGPDRVVNGDSASRDTEALLRAVKARIRDKSDEALAQIRGGAAVKPDEATLEQKPVDTSRASA